MTHSINYTSYRSTRMSACWLKHRRNPPLIDIQLHIWTIDLIIFQSDFRISFPQALSLVIALDLYKLLSLSMFKYPPKISKHKASFPVLLPPPALWTSTWIWLDDCVEDWLFWLKLWLDVMLPPRTYVCKKIQDTLVCTMCMNLF